MLIKSYIILGDIYTTKENLFMFQVFVDSAANLPAVTAKKYDIHVVSFVNLVNGKELVCFDPDLSPEEELAKGKEYYNAMRTGCEIKTGLISTANFADAFRTALRFPECLSCTGHPRHLCQRDARSGHERRRSGRSSGNLR